MPLCSVLCVVQCHYAECHYALCRYAFCRYSERRGAAKSRLKGIKFYDSPAGWRGGGSGWGGGGVARSNCLLELRKKLSLFESIFETFLLFELS